MNRQLLARKAEEFRALHYDPKLLVLPNVWDPLGARLLQGLGYPAVATASAAVAFSLGYDDGERITFEAMLDVIRRVAASVDIPVSADIEGGYATDPETVAAHVVEVLRAGAVGINLEDSFAERTLYPTEQQCDRIRAVRELANAEGIPLVINARTDVFMVDTPGSHADKLTEAIARAKAYRAAGANCIYPILLADLDSLRRIREQTDAPLNVFASADTASPRDLEAAGIARLSLGPGLLRACFTTMHRVACELLDTGSYDSFTKQTFSSDEIRKYVSKDRMA